MKAIWVAGYPSFYGGADTELDHNIDLWRQLGIEINLVPMFGNDPKMKERCDARGCITHEYHPAIFEGKVVASWCNGQFLERLPEIVHFGKPEKVVWFNCMTWTFPKEIEAHQNGWIDAFGFVSSYQRSMLQPILEKIAPVKALEGYAPYFDPSRIVRNYLAPSEHFALGRCSRNDPAKFSDDMWRIFDRVLTPVPKKVYILGYSDVVEKKVGPPPAGLDWQWWIPGAISATELYAKLHCLIHKTGGSRESYCRIVPECYANGVPIIVEDDYAFPELVVDGITGFRCKTSEEMSYRASQLAFNEKLRFEIIVNARTHLLDVIASADRCGKPWLELLS